MEKRKFLLTALAIILVAGFLLRLFPVRGGYHYWDETVYLQHAEILNGESPDNYNEFEFRPPLFSFILAATFVINSSLLSAHLTVAGLSSLAIILVYILGRELYSRQTALIATAIYSASPLGIMLSHDILVDPILPLFWIATAIALNRALKTDKIIYYFSTGLMASLAVLIKFTSLVILPAVALVVLIAQMEQDQLDMKNLVRVVREICLSRNNWLMAAGFLTGLAPYFGWSYIEFGSPLHVFLTAWTKSGARDAFMTYINGWNSYLLTPLYLGIPLFLWKADLKKLKNYLPLIFFSSLYLSLQFVVANKETRFLMPIVPFIALMAAEGLRKLRSGNVINNIKFSKSVFAFIVLSSVLLLPTSMPDRNVFAQGLANEWEAPVKDAGEWLEQNTDENAVLYTNYQYPALGYYSKREIVWFREYVSLEKIIGEELNEPGYIYYSKESAYPHPALNNLETDPRFSLNKTFENTIYLFYFKGVSQ